MAKSRNTEQVRLAGVMRRPRRALMVTTALQATVALVLALPARAQLAPNARPTGGVVVAGSASISQTPNATNIDQSSQRAALNWQSFNVGSRQSVNFHQPNANAVALNRVVGPDPSQIAGQINANGQVILENQDGITFSKGAQVNTAGFVATTSGITDKNFMAGHMVFDQPGKPGASVVNEGHITVRQAGIAALVAPQVANSGVITAQLGRVVLAGATRYTLDLYGDGLVSIDVTGSVKQVPVGPGGATATALVTNSGTILAAGGRIELTARAAAGLVQELVAAGGKIAAPTAGAQTGQIVLNGIGGSIVIAGQLDATGAGAGEHGGAIQVSPAGGVVLASTARVDASGRAGGGTVAIGTDLARASGGPKVTPAVLSHDVTVSRGATIAADATGRGNGGRITVLSADSTVMDGAISARGGKLGGNGGFVEVSGRTLGFDGEVNVGAVRGQLGTVLFDPVTLDVVAGTSIGAGTLDGSLTAGSGFNTIGTIPATLDATGTDTVSNFAINQIGSTGNVVLQAGTLLDVQAAVSVTHGLALQSGDNLVVDPGASITAGGNILLSAADTSISGNNAAGSITLGANITTTSGTLALSAGTGGIALGGVTLNAPTVDLTVVGVGAAGVSQSVGGTIVAGVLQSGGRIVGGATLIGTNTIAALGSLTVTNGDLTLGDTGSLSVTGPVSANDVAITAGTLGVTGGITATGVGGTIALTGTAGALGLTSAAAVLNGPTITLNGGASAVNIGSLATVNAGTLLALGGAGVSENATAAVAAPTLVSLGTIGGAVDLAGTVNAIGSVGGFTVVTGGNFALIDAPGQTLALNGLLSAAGATITVGADSLKFGAFSSLVASTVALAPVSATSTVTLDSSASAHFALINAGRIDIGRLDSNGSITAGAISITAGVSVPATTTVGLYSTGKIVETGAGSLIAGALAGEADGGATLGGANTIGAMSGFIAAGQTFDLKNDASQVSLGGSIGVGTFVLIDPTGTVTIPGTIIANQITIDPTSIDVSGTMSSPTLITLDALTGGITLESTSALLTPTGSLELTATGGGVTQAAGGVISAGTLFSAGSVVGTVDLAGANTIASVGSFTVASGDFLLTDSGQTGALLLPGTLTANNVTLGTPGTIDLNGGTIALSGGTLVALNAGAGGITLGAAALVNAGSGGTLALGTTGGGVSEASTGTILAGMLISASAVTGTADLVGSNTLATLGSFTVTGGDFTLVGAGSLSVAGPVRATNVSIAAGTLDVGGSVAAGTAAGNTLALTTNAGTLGLDNGAVLSGATIALNGNGFAVNIGSVAVVDAATLLDLGGAGVNEIAGGTIIAGTLAGLNTLTAGVSLLGSNTIAALGGITLSAGNFLLADGGESAGTLTVTGTLLAPATNGATIALGLGSALPGAIEVVSGGAVDVGRSNGGEVVLDVGTGGISLASGAFVGGFNFNTVDVSTAGGGVTENAAARIAAAYLQSSGSVTGTVDLAGLTNALPQINGFVVTGGNLIVVDQPGQALTVAGSVSAVGGTIDVTADGLFLATGGSLVANRFAVMPSSAAGNPMTVLAVEPGTLQLGTFVVNGQIAAGQIDLGSLDGGASTPAASAISIAGGISMPAATLGLYAVGGISETAAGLLTAAALTGQAGAPVSLGNANSIGTLGAFAVSGSGNGFALNDIAALTVAGSVAAPGQVFLEDSAAGGVTLGATGVIAGATLDSVKTDAFTIVGGGAVAGATFELAPDTGGSLMTLGGSGGLSLASLAGIGPATLRFGAVTLPGSSAPTITAGSIAVAGPFGATGDAIELDALNGIGGAGPLTAGTLSGNAGIGALVLPGTTNAVAALGDFVAQGFTLGDGVALSVNGTVNGGAVTAGTVLLQATDLTIGGTVSDGGAGTTTLVATGGTIAETGTLRIGTLSGNSVTDTSLLSATNTIVTLSTFTAGGSFALAGDGARSLAITGPVAGTNIRIGGAPASPQSIVVSGSVNASGTTLALTSGSGGITLGTGGTLLATAGTVALDGGTGTIALTDGLVHAATLSLADSAAVTQGSSNTIDAGALISGTGLSGAVGLISTTNTIATLGGFTTVGALTLDDNGTLTVSGAVSASSVTLATTGTGQIAATGAVTATTGTVSVTSGSGGILVNGGGLIGPTVLLNGGGGTIAIDGPGGTVGQSGASVTLSNASGVSESGSTGILAGTLASAGALAGPVSLTDNGNAIGTLAAFAVTGGNLTLQNSLGLTVTGPVSGSGNISLTNAGSIDVLGALGANATTGTLALTSDATGLAFGTGAVVTGATLSLDGNGGPIALSGNAALGQTGGTVVLLTPGGTVSELGSSAITASVLETTGAGVGAAVLTDTNHVTTLGSFTSAGTLALTNAGDLSVTGPVVAANASLLSGGTVWIPGTISVGGLTLQASGQILETGTLLATSLTGSAGAAANLSGASATANRIATVNGFSAAGFTLRDGEAVTIGGTVNGNASATITDSAGITVAGEVTAGTVLLQGSDLTIGGTVSDGGAGTTTLVATTGTIYETGAVDAGLLTGSSGSATTLLGANRIAGLGSFTATAIDMTDNVPLTLSGTITAPLIQIDAGTNQISIASGTTLITGGSARPTGTFGSAFADPLTNPGSYHGGAYLSDFAQHGAVTILGIGGQPAILEISANGGGNIAFDRVAGLTGSNTWLILKMNGGSSGFASGNVFVRWLDVLFSPGSFGGGASLNGTVDGIGGAVAAGIGHISPRPDPRFRINTCAIGSVNCIVLPVEVLPLANPLEEFSLGSLMNTNDDGDLFLPIVSDRDY